MDIKCERCGTEYEFDDDRVTENGVTVKCSSCGHLFKVRKKSFVLTEPVPQDGAEADSVEKNWMVRKPDGTMLSFKELTTLQKWIVERKVSRDDEISKSGETWKRLGSIAELASFFQVVDQANAVSQPPATQAPVALPPAAQAPVTQPPAAQAPVTQPPATQPPVAQAPSTSEIAAMETQGIPAASQPVMPQQGIPPASQPVMPAQGVPPASQPVMPAQGMPPASQPVMPAQGMPPASQPVMPAMGGEPDSWGDGGYDAVSEDVVEKWKRRGRRKWFVIVPLVLILAGLGVVYLVAPEKLQEIANSVMGSDDKDATKPAPQSGQSQNAVALIDGGSTDAAVDASAAVSDAEADAGTSAADRSGADKPAASDAGAAKVADKAKPVKSVHKDDTGEPMALGYDALMAKADRLQRAGRSGKALEAYDEALNIKPQDVEALTGKGLCLLDMGSNSSAISAFKKALKINPRYGDAIMGAAEAYKYRKDTANAIKYYKRYLDVLPDGPEAAVARSNLEQLK